ncbi:calcium-dependent phosphoinositide phospholipase C [Zymomonas mobilis]|uniref:Calcium-dependent phosphoinositide phospholipase C n=1 Tax=Zymomonas mobilis TaxID=542 RepID=A0A542VUN5_ZYMMB|nr:phosphatidylinositol-specific phospholipase C domain-containing protein [Zymomonas mobilis]TQL15031.1 calcium-dependent phosphoinositide phospholipase C [Zymomonas mobilis]
MFKILNKYIPICGVIFLASTPHIANANMIPDNTPINKIQVIGTHNSYNLGVDPHIRKVIDDFFASSKEKISKEKLEEFELAHPNHLSPSETLSYSHPSIKKQLDMGVRSLEIDANADPEGGAYADPILYKILKERGVNRLPSFDVSALKQPGIKILHIPDVDIHSSCPTLRICLTQMKNWSESHPRHIPIFVMIEAKVQPLNLKLSGNPDKTPNFSKIPPFTDETYNEIDQTIVDVLGRNKVITPDDVRGSYPNLEDAVLAGNWPTLGQARGKFIFFLTTATGRDGASAYLNGHLGLKGRMAFMDSEPGKPYAAFVLEDNALSRGDIIRNDVKKGYIVRTRADIDTYEAKKNDLTRAKAAFDSGAQIVSTDYEAAGNAYHTPYVVKLPGKNKDARIVSH